MLGIRKTKTNMNEDISWFYNKKTINVGTKECDPTKLYSFEQVCVGKNYVVYPSYWNKAEFSYVKIYCCLSLLLRTCSFACLIVFAT